MIEKKHKGERLLEIDNLHCANCGPPPLLAAADKYLGYFENFLGEQWVFIGDPKTGEAAIRGGDTGWATEYKVSLEKPCPDDLILQEAEKHWIITCFMAMSDTAYALVASNFAAGDYFAAALGIATALGKGLTAKPADDHGKNGANGDHRKDVRPGE